MRKIKKERAGRRRQEKAGQTEEQNVVTDLLPMQHWSAYCFKLCFFPKVDPAFFSGGGRRLEGCAFLFSL